MFRIANGTLDTCRFCTLSKAGSYTNFDVVNKMSENDYKPAKSALVKLKNMTSRERSESGIYWKLQKTDAWVIAQEQLHGTAAGTPVIVKITSTVSRDSISRQRKFESMVFWYKDRPGSHSDRIPYTKEIMTIHVDVK
jgi:hypothetical protein